jgi:exosortase K
MTAARERIAMPVAAVLIAVGLKAHYRAAAPGDLHWILAPTAGLVGWLRREPLAFEASLGWVPADHGFVIAPACAGVNFMILLFLTSVLGFAGRFERPGRRSAWLASMLASAWALTIAVNSLRIVAAVALYEGELHAGWLTADRVHRVAGILIYLSALSAAWVVLDRVSASLGSAGRQPLTAARVAPPFLGYVGMTVLLPLANGAWRHFGARYAEHALTVCAFTLLAAVLLLVMVRVATSQFMGPTACPTRSGSGGDADGQAAHTGGRR